MSERGSLFDARHQDGKPQFVTPGQVIDSAWGIEDHQPVIRTVCLTSGGGDSTVLAHSCRHYYDELVHIDTGTALPGVRRFVHEFANLLRKPLRVVEAGNAYERLVLGHPDFWPIFEKHRLPDEGPDHYRRRVLKLPTREQRMAHGAHLAPLGFPGPAGHKFAYEFLKARALAQGVRDIKAEHGNGTRRQRVILLSGVRMDESERRKMNGAAQGYYERRGNQIWVNPLLDWTNEEMRAYRAEYRLPVSDVTALTHRSGECNCMAFTSQGERDFVISMYPDWYRDRILPIEQEAERLGLEHSRWAWADKESKIGFDDIGPMCRGCEIQAAELAA